MMLKAEDSDLLKGFIVGKGKLEYLFRNLQMTPFFFSSEPLWKTSKTSS